MKVSEKPVSASTQTFLGVCEYENLRIADVESAGSKTMKDYGLKEILTEAAKERREELILTRHDVAFLKACASRHQ